METINNVANAAAKAVWGSPESHQEPVSGKRGNTAEGQPYDAGNMRPEEAANLATPADDKLSGAQLGTTANAESSAATASAGSLGGENPSAIGKSELENSDSALGHASKPVAADSAAGGQHDTSSPSARPEENPVPEADLAKPGPKPLEVLAREHGGDAGNVGKDGGARTQPSENSEVREESHGDGTGEQYVKSTGFAAEGGDFDAANPGAGREADRLAGEHDGSLSVAPSDKHHDNSASKQTSNSSTGSGEKRTLKEKIKAKLHRH